MGPLIINVSKQIHPLASSRYSGPHEQGKPKGARGSSGIFEHRFGAMKDEGLGDTSLLAVNSPAIQGRASQPSDEAYAMDQLGEHGIRVKTDLKQSYDIHMPGACSVNSVV